jgi:ribonucleotide reductase class II
VVCCLGTLYLRAKHRMKEFRDTAPSAETVFLRTYSRRKEDGTRENFEEAMLRTVNDIARIGQYDQDEYALVREQALAQRAFPSGRSFWVAGTDWSKKPENFSGYYNCTSTHIEDLQAFGLLVDLAMQGSGTGAVLEQDVICKLPPVTRTLTLETVSDTGTEPGLEDTKCIWDDHEIHIRVGDSRKGWKDAYMALLYQATSTLRNTDCHVYVDLSQVRPSGKRLKGFGGTANPVKLPSMFGKVIDILNEAKGRQLTSIEACLLIDEAATCIVAGNIRRSAGMRQFSQGDSEAATAKTGLYSQDSEGNWRVDPKKEALRMANHTRCYHTKPSYEEVASAVEMQFQSGEGAIQYVPEAVARANVDLLNTSERKRTFLKAYADEGGRRSYAENVLRSYAAADKLEISDREFQHRMDRYGLNPCGEIIGRDFHCNLAEVHLNTIDPNDYDAQDKAFYAAGLQVAALLQHEFVHDRYQYSREIDPIVGVSFTGLFDFLVHSGGYDWLKWMMEGRKGRRASDMYVAMEQHYLRRWRESAHRGVKAYCKKHGLRVPNRITTVQPAGTKSLLTGASSGWHPPKAQRFIRRITLGINDPLVPALIEYGFSVIPAQSARDEEGNLLDDISDPRVQEVLVEIPTEVSWANIPGCDEFDLAQLPVESQYGLYMNVQRCYVDHNCSATIELREEEIPTLAKLIHEDIEGDRGYISAALLARFDIDGGTFPRLPFEPIDKETYDRLMMIQNISQMGEDRSLLDILVKYDNSEWTIESVAGCTNASCVAKADADEREKNL